MSALTSYDPLRGQRKPRSIRRKITANVRANHLLNHCDVGIKSQKSDPPKPSKKENDVSLVQLLKEIPQRIPFQGKPTKTTFSVALPVSLVQNIQTDELRAYIIGSIARTLTIYGIHEVILYNDIG